MFLSRLRPPFLAPLLLALAAGGLGCTETDKQSYRFDIRGPKEAFPGAATVILSMGELEVARTSTTGGGFTLERKDVDPAQTASTVFAVRVLDAAQKLVAFGQTPEIEVLNRNSALSIFVQPPGTIAQSRLFNRGIRDHLAVAATSQAAGTGQRLQTTLPVFGFGRERRFEASGALPEDMAGSNELLIYNPYTHTPERLVTLGEADRADTAAAVRADTGAIYIFGGLLRDATARVSADLDIVNIARSDLAAFGAITRSIPGRPEAARRQTVMAAAGRFVVAFGGLGGDPEMPLDTIVMIDPDGKPSTPIVVAPPRMTAPRHRHTVSTVFDKTKMRPLLLAFGGAPTGGSPADLFDPTDQMLVPFAEMPPAGSGRRDHAAVEITVGNAAERQILLIGGLGDDGKPRTDALLFDPLAVKFTVAPLVLRTPRSRFTAFVINKDIVVVGGVGADGQPVPNAEIHDATTLMFVQEVPAVARSGATASMLSNSSVAIIGGRGAGDEAASSSREIEIYQPRRLP